MVGGEDGRQGFGLAAHYECQAGNNGRSRASVERLNHPLRPAVRENGTVESLMIARKREQNAIAANAPLGPPASLFHERGAVERTELPWPLVSADQAGQRTQPNANAPRQNNTPSLFEIATLPGLICHLVSTRIFTPSSTFLAEAKTESPRAQRFPSWPSSPPIIPRI